MLRLPDERLGVGGQSVLKYGVSFAEWFPSIDGVGSRPILVCRHNGWPPFGQNSDSEGQRACAIVQDASYGRDAIKFHFCTKLPEGKGLAPQTVAWFRMKNMLQSKRA